MKSFLFLILAAVFYHPDAISQVEAISFMTYNIRYATSNDEENAWEERKQDVTRLVDFYHPDFLGIQEGLHHQVVYLLENISNYQFIGVGRDDGKNKGEYSALFYDTTRFELLEDHTFWLSETPEKISVGWDASMERICTWGKFKNKAKEEFIYVFNTHFDHIGPEARKNSAKLILSTIEKLQLENEKVVVMGDLNSEPESEPIITFKTKFDDAMSIASRKFYGPIGTFNGFDPMVTLNRRIDYIFTLNMRVLAYQHIDDRRSNSLWISDHLPVLVETQ